MQSLAIPTRRPVIGTLALVLALAFVSAGQAQWPGDPAVNLAVADRVSEQVTPIPVVTSDGGCYVSWFDLASGNYDVYLQRLDRNGYELWPHNGVLVSDYPQNTSLVAWDLMCDHEDNAILIFGDARAGSDLDVQAYKVSPDGELLWGPEGVTLSTNSDFEPGGCVTEATDGDIVVAWARLPDAGPGTIQMQRLSPDGVERFPHNGIAIVTPTSESPAFPDIVPTLAGGVIVSWVRDISQYVSPRHIHAQSFGADGAPLWGAPLVVFDAAAVPLGYYPKIQSDLANGFVCAWHASLNNLHSSRYQHVDPEGLELLPHNGIAVTTATMHHIDPSLAYHPATGEAFVFWNERNPNQTLWGIYGQRISAAGVRLWGESGAVLLPVNSTYKSYPRAVPCSGGAMVFVADWPAAPYVDRLIGMRVDESGAMVWPGSPIDVATVFSAKARYPVVINGSEMAVLVWEDDRNGAVDLYAQNVNGDGSLGVSPGSVAPGAAEPGLVARVASNPVLGATQFSVAAAQIPGGACIEIRDVAGRLLRLLPLEPRASGLWFAPWNGRDSRGERVPAGVYFHRLVAASGAPASAGRVVVLE